MEPDAVEIRVVGCLVEKQRTTPDAYPLSLNALRLACNQSTNRDPVVDYDEATVSDALRRLALRGWTRLASGAGSRARKYRHLLPEALGIDEEELALLAVLMLRGAQTPGELKQRSERLHGSPTWRRCRRPWSGCVERELRRPPPAPPGPEGGSLRAGARGGDGRGSDPAGAAPPAPASAARPTDAPPGSIRAAIRAEDRLDRARARVG